MLKKSVFGIVLTLLLMGMLTLTWVRFVRAASFLTTLVVQSPNHVYESWFFSVNVAVQNVTGLFGWEFWLEWDASVVRCLNETVNLSIWPYYQGPWVTEPIDNTNGRYHQSLTAAHPSTPINGSFVLVTLAFQVITTPPTETAFTLHKAEGYTAYCLVDITGEEIPHEYSNGHVVIPSLPVVHDIAVTDLRSSAKVGYVGDVISFEVDVANEGTPQIENVSLTLFADNDTAVIGDELVLGTKTIELPMFGSLTVPFSWNTSGTDQGNYTLSASATPIEGEVNLANNIITKGNVRLFSPGGEPCQQVIVTCPENLTMNPSLFSFNYLLQARLVNIGNVTVQSTGFDGMLRALGSRNGTVRLSINQPDHDEYSFYLALNHTIKVPIWLMFQPEEHWGYYVGTYTLRLTICGTHRRYLTITNINIDVCRNGAYVVRNDTATFTWNLTGGSLVYLEAEPELPPGWTYTVDPPIGSFFETPHVVTVNITAPPDAREGDIGRVTLRAYKNSTGQIIWQFIYFATTDRAPPVVDSVATPVMFAGGSLKFETSVHAHSGIASVKLHYSINGGEWQNTTMKWEAGDTFNSTQYVVSGTYGTGEYAMEYHISTVDWLGMRTETANSTIYVMPDLSLVSASKNKTVVDQKRQVSLAVSVLNKGSLPLSGAKIAVFANSSVIWTGQVPFMQGGSQSNLTILLNTSVIPKGRYMITVKALPLKDEANVIDNALPGGWLTVTIEGDINGDHYVNAKDAIALGTAFYPFGAYNPNADINNDGYCNAKDAVILGTHFNEHWE